MGGRFIIEKREKKRRKKEGERDLPPPLGDTCLPQRRLPACACFCITIKVREYIVKKKKEKGEKKKVIRGDVRLTGTARS